MEATLCEFKAGKLKFNAGQLIPDARKGLVRVVQTEDTLVHVQWCERTAAGTAAAAEEDVIVFPGEAVLEKIPNQRALVLRFTDDKTRNVYFWLQELKPEEDGAHVTAFNRAVNHPAEDLPAAGGLDVGGVAPRSALEHAHVSSAPGAGASLEQGGTAVQIPTGPAQTPGSTAAVNAQATDLATILGNAIAAGLGGGSRPAYGSEEALAQSLLAQLAAAQGGLGGRRRAVAAPGPSLADVLRPETLGPLLREPGVLEALGPHLPEEHRTPEHLAALAHSPQFQQQLSTFSAALQTGQLDLSQFGLRAAGFTVADFLRAVQDLVERERAQGQQGQGQGGAPMEQ
ncbi:hypothetical protein HYH03_003329 [Edaphochlamys debaryana]|uniref:Uncharacterized protein n=1 Tax=Edaphochlamys debaryana TaxID=47281 RepID=A0A835YC65_9CHLO|nr:hypothetical protein HYH03_003329 [Edaphochlamys debaryana]|eukprot:KAG2498578.1 hypothetical protein HYH03_003329 [Edaphochlamys debaryana]